MLNIEIYFLIFLLITYYLYMWVFNSLYIIYIESLYHCYLFSSYLPISLADNLYNLSFNIMIGWIYDFFTLFFFLSLGLQFIHVLSFSLVWQCKYLSFSLDWQCEYLVIYSGLTTASVVEGLESMTSNPVTSLTWVRSPGDALVV
jgi:hypothetical protein